MFNIHHISAGLLHKTGPAVTKQESKCVFQIGVRLGRSEILTATSMKMAVP
jgi:hypothetical protein